MKGVYAIKDHVSLTVDFDEIGLIIADNEDYDDGNTGFYQFTISKNDDGVLTITDGKEPVIQTKMKLGIKESTPTSVEIVVS